MLKGLRVVLTRTEAQNNSLAEAILHAGGTPISFPTLEIEAVDHTAPLAECADVQVLVFTSPNAVAYLARLPAGAEAAYCVAMGAGTAAQLKARGWRVDWVAPKGATSETVLALLPQGLFQGRHVCFVRGLNGRTMLRAAIEPIAMKLSDLVVYRRLCPDRWSTPLPAPTDVVVITSLDGFRHWVHLLGPTHLRAWAQVPHLMTSQRQLDVARGMPCFTQLRCASAPDTASIVAGLIEWRLL